MNLKRNYHHPPISHVVIPVISLLRALTSNKNFPSIYAQFFIQKLIIITAAMLTLSPYSSPFHV